ncbi:MAG: hypothetical protein GY906_11170 [bacterium]|nr:hypothetical protein [bacterium]
MKRTLILAALLTLVAAGAIAQEPTENPYQGFIYGTITTRSDTAYTGVLRWNTEEAFWDDLFHSSKEEVQFAEKYEKEARDSDRDENWWHVFGRKIGIRVEGDPSRVLAVRFGDLKEIRVVGRNSAELLLKNGSTLEVRGYSNDVGATVKVRDTTLGDIEVPWKKIKKIAFAATPTDADPGVFRLAGTVDTDAGELRGYIQWDEQECLSTDRLDGETEDGDLSIEMGRIARIERRNRRSSIVTLRDGRELVMDGTNDVNNDNRGIFVEDPRYGRVAVQWNEFRSVDFDAPGGSGRSYDEFSAQEPLRGTVTERDGTRHTGRLIWDLDESQEWEMLDGIGQDLDYAIPFAMIAALEPVGSHGTRVELRSGEQIELEEGQDVSERNDGVVVISESGKETYIAFSDITRVEFDRE